RSRIARPSFNPRSPLTNQWAKVGARPTPTLPTRRPSTVDLPLMPPGRMVLAHHALGERLEKGVVFAHRRDGGRAHIRPNHSLANPLLGHTEGPHRSTGHKSGRRWRTCGAPAGRTAAGNRGHG